MHLIGQGQV